MAQQRPGFARVVVAVVIEKNDLAADLLLKFPRGLDLGEEESSREESARLLAEADDRGGRGGGRGGGHDAGDPSSGRGRAPARSCNTTLSITHARQPITLYQR